MAATALWAFCLTTLPCRRRDASSQGSLAGSSHHRRQSKPPLTHCKQCKKPTSKGINSYYPNKVTYNPGDQITVQCMMGYSPPSRTITCVSSGASSTWDKSAPCVAQCTKPTSAGLDPGAPQYKSYYNPEEVITVQCMMGYSPISKTMRCVNDGARSNWNVSVPCVEFDVQEQITSTSISLQWVCRPGPCDSYWGWIYVSFWLKGSWISEEYPRTGDVTFPGLQPFTEYKITIEGDGHQTGARTTLRETTITTRETVSERPEIMKYPSMAENTITWRILSDNMGIITGYQINISAWRDYNSSFSHEESHWFGPDVTEYKIQLKYGSNYTVTLRGFTSAGAGEAATWTGETPIAVLNSQP
ncbi:uncharacterized protein O3C94_004336 [Discoglossus pictus]